MCTLNPSVCITCIMLHQLEYPVQWLTFKDLEFFYKFFLSFLVEGLACLLLIIERQKKFRFFLSTFRNYRQKKS